MPRNSKKSRSTKTKSWKQLHHRVDFTPKDEKEMIEWVKERKGDIGNLLVQMQENEWAVKVSPMDGGETAYITVQSKSEDDEWGDHSFGTIWPNNLGAWFVAAYLTLVMGERGDLYREVPATMADVLDFLA